MPKEDKRRPPNTTGSKSSSNDCRDQLSDEANGILNLCADLVSHEANERFVVSLMSETPKGHWSSVAALCRASGVVLDDISDDVFVAWLDDPHGDSAYALIVFFDDDSKLSAAAHYNRERLQIGTS